MPDWLTQLTKESVHQALLRTAGLDTTPSRLMNMFTADGKQFVRSHTFPPDLAPTPAAVLILLYDYQDELHLVLTERTPQMRRHAGQISFPGGRSDPQDSSPYATALREAQEELGVDPSSLTLWTDLNTIYVSPSNYMVHPFIAYCANRPAFQPNPSEVHAILEVPLRHLLLPESLASEQRELEGQIVLVPHYVYRDQIIWGATAKVISQLLSRIEVGISELQA